MTYILHISNYHHLQSAQIAPGHNKINVFIVTSLLSCEIVDHITSKRLWGFSEFLHHLWLRFLNPPPSPPPPSLPLLIFLLFHPLLVSVIMCFSACAIMCVDVPEEFRLSPFS